MLPREFQRDGHVEVLIIQPVPREVQHEGDYERFLAAHCCIRAQIVLEVALARIAIVADNPKNYVLALYVSIEPSESMFRDLETPI